MNLLKKTPVIFLAFIFSMVFQGLNASAQPAGNFTPINKPDIENGIEVQIISVKVENAPLERMGGYFSQSPDQQLVIKIVIVNKTGGQINYQTWRGDETGLNGATVQDEQGTQYQKTSPPEGFHVVGAVNDSANISPGQTLADVITFQKPNPGVKRLYITLPGSNVNAQQDFDFVAPAPAGN
ncbi:MAG TPA: hypothetical protein VKJ65_10560 [Phycisphaerae bacterium]|nr:hypothetical protein [Phycisphaerae bacterium]